MEIIDAHTHIGDVCSPYSQTVRAAIAGSNQGNLLENLGYPAVLTRFVASRLFPKPSLLRYCRAMATKATPNNLLASMREANILKSFVLPIAPAVSTDEVLNSCEYKSELIPLISIDFRNLNASDIKKQLQNYRARYPFIGVKFHPNLQNVQPLAETACGLYEGAAELGLFIVMHAGRTPFLTGPQREYALAENIVGAVRKFPKTRFVLSHMGSYFDWRSDVQEQFADNENVSFDTSGIGWRAIARGLQIVGFRRVLFGSDWPYGTQLASWKIVVHAVSQYCRGSKDNVDNILSYVGSRNATALSELARN